MYVRWIRFLRLAENVISMSWYNILAPLALSYKNSWSLELRCSKISQYFACHCTYKNRSFLLRIKITVSMQQKPMYTVKIWSLNPQPLPPSTSTVLSCNHNSEYLFSGESSQNSQLLFSINVWFHSVFSWRYLSGPDSRSSYGFCIHFIHVIIPRRKEFSTNRHLCVNR